MKKYQELKTELDNLRQLDATTAKAYNANLLELGDIKAERDRLKAANAEMLEALKHAAMTLELVADGKPQLADVDYEIMRARAAIAKAEGK